MSFIRMVKKGTSLSEIVEKQQADFPIVLKKAMKNWLEVEIRSRVVMNIRSKVYFETHPTGKLAQGMLTEVKDGDDTVVVGSLYSLVPWAGIQEFGGTIVPVKAKALTIPTDYVKTKAGRVQQGATFFKDAFIPKGKNYIARIDESGKLIPLFILRKRVKLQGKFYIKNAIEAAMPFAPDFIDTYFREWI